MAPSVASPNDFPQRTAGVRRRLGTLILEHPHKHGGRGAEPPRQSEAMHCVRDPTIPAVLSPTNPGWASFGPGAVSTWIGGSTLSAISVGMLL